MHLNHVALTVSDRERSAAFYGRHFGLTERVHDDGHLLILGSPDGSLIALSEGPVPTELPRTNHFGFQLEDADGVRRVRERLHEAGVRETEWQDDHGFVRVQVADPDGYRVELFATENIPAPRSLRRPARSRWTSFLADPNEERPRVLSEQGNPDHRLRVEHNRDTLLVHLSDEDGGDGPSWRSIARPGAGPSPWLAGSLTPPKTPTPGSTARPEPEPPASRGTCLPHSHRADRISSSPVNPLTLSTRLLPAALYLEGKVRLSGRPARRRAMSFSEARGLEAGRKLEERHEKWRKPKR